MNITTNKENRTYSIERDDGTVVELTCNEVSLLVNYVGKEGLRAQIADRVDNAIDDEGLNLDKYNGTREEFEEEIFVELEDEIDFGNSVSDEWVDERIRDTASYYDLYATDDDEEEEE